MQNLAVFLPSTGEGETLIFNNMFNPSNISQLFIYLPNLHNVFFLACTNYLFLKTPIQICDA